MVIFAAVNETVMGLFQSTIQKKYLKEAEESIKNEMRRKQKKVEK